MPVPSKLYRPSLALLTDFYELTMAYAAWKEGIDRREASFVLSFRRNPFQGGFTVAAGLEPAMDLVEHWRFEEDDLAFLEAQRGADGAPIFERGFLEHLSRVEMAVDVDAVPEGTVVFPHEPLLRITGPVIPCLLLETAVLTIVNFQTLIATKAARVCLAARGEPVIEFGLRRAQGIDGGLSATRAAFVGGCHATSNTLAGKLWGIPVRGTHAHSWVMLHDSEREAFLAFARAVPGTCVFLVDTYGTREGLENAIEVGRWLRSQGKELAGIRLDSGDLAWLSQEARRILDEAGFPKAAILASNELDEHVIDSLKDQGAKVAVWGVGTRLVTGHDDGALGGVYKLGAVRESKDVPWKPRVKVSEQIEKTTIPGLLQVRRFSKDGEFTADAIFDETLGLPSPAVIVDPADPLRRREIPAGAAGADLLVPVFRGGRRLYAPPPLDEVRARTGAQLAGFHGGVKRFMNPHEFPVGLERRLHELRAQLVLAARGAAR
ncbi:MAG TPA: nicotinate phosphoribosyltransferase [Anaeromyxobacter sp.]